MRTIVWFCVLLMVVLFATPYATAKTEPGCAANECISELYIENIADRYEEQRLMAGATAIGLGVGYVMIGNGANQLIASDKKYDKTSYYYSGEVPDKTGGNILMGLGALSIVGGIIQLNSTAPAENSLALVRKVSDLKEREKVGAKELSKLASSARSDRMTWSIVSLVLGGVAYAVTPTEKDSKGVNMLAAAPFVAGGIAGLCSRSYEEINEGRYQRRLEQNNMANSTIGFGYTADKGAKVAFNYNY